MHLREISISNDSVRKVVTYEEMRKNPSSQHEHSWELGNVLLTSTTDLPYYSALYFNMVLNWYEDTSAMALALFLFFIILDTYKLSIPITSWFLMMSLEVLCKKFVRLFWIFSWIRATFFYCLRQLLEPMICLDNTCWAFANFSSRLLHMFLFILIACK
jgi:hypothetical protein